MTAPPGAWVAKVGGSLYDHPHLIPALRTWCAERGDGPGLLVAGGGASADAVRQLDRTHQLGEAEAHRLALLALAVPMQMLTRQLGLPAPIAWLDWWAAGHQLVTLDAAAFLDVWGRERGPVPATWALTTDSIAAYAARTAGCELVLLKSVDIPEGMAWETAAAAGWVDGEFARSAAGLRVRGVNFRTRLGAL